MLIDKLPVLRGANLVLASGSPRRKEILNDVLGLDVQVVPSTFAEDLDKSTFTPASYVQENARIKALEVWAQLRGTADAASVPDLVIGGDTVVSLDGSILEKPRDREHAISMLGGLSGSTHKVYSGVALVYRRPGAAPGAEPSVLCFAEETDVTFAPLSSETIAAYVDSGEPMDKAGGYGIQAAGGQFVSGITGCFYNVMGFPMHRFAAELVRLLERNEIALSGGGAADDAAA